MTNKERIQCVLAGAFIGNRLTLHTTRQSDGKCICDMSFVVRTVTLQDDGYLSVYGDKLKDEYDHLELLHAIKLADEGALAFSDCGCTKERSFDLKYILTKEKML